MPDSPTTDHLLIVEDDKNQAEELVEYFASHGFMVDIACDGNQFRTLFAKNPYDLVIMDLGLPGDDGLRLTQDLRKSSNVPVIMVTGRSDPVDRVVGLELGADDYVVKPYDPRELLARVTAVLRRRPAAPADKDGDTKQNRKLEFSGYQFNPELRSVTTSDGVPVELTSTEYELLALFISRPGRPLTRDFLTQRVFNRDWDLMDRSIDNLVLHLRKKLPSSAGLGESIKTVRGVGYVFADKIETV